MNEDIKVDDTVDTPVEDVMDLFPTDHDMPDEEATDEIAEDEDIDESTTDDEESEESEEESKEETEEPETVALEDFELKVLGETKLLKDIPREELQPLLQKGSDYDRVKEKLNVSQDEINEWKELSEMFEMSPQEVRESLKEQHFKDIAETDGRNVDDVRREYSANKKSIQDKMYEKFLDKYPDINTDELPQSVIDDVRLGKDLTNVYDSFLKSNEMSEKDNKISEYENKIKELEATINLKKQNKSTKKKGIIKKTSGTDSNTDTDDFLQGLTGDY